MQKLKAGALQLTLFICVVIALLLAAFIILVHTHKRFNTLSDMTIETVKNADKGIVYALSNKLTLNDSIDLKLESDIGETIKVYRSYWGLFEKVTSNAIFKSKRINKTALIGGVQSKTNRTALYLQENNKPLVLVGNTRIQGGAYVSKRGVKSGNISGTSYYGHQLIYGQSRISTSFPRLFSETQQNLERIQNGFNGMTNEAIINITKEKSHENSFFNSKKYVISNSAIILSNISLTGHIMVMSQTKIVVDASTKLKDVVLIAPKIEIRDNVSGTFQAIATNEILVGKNCNLKYPSALVVKESKPVLNEKELNKILIDSSSNISGVVVYLGKPKRNNTKTQLVIEEQATVTGEVYCNQNLELKGTINGCVFTSNFMANQFGSIYQNHIYNGNINIDELPKEYVGLSFINQKKGVLKWLY